MPADPSMSGFFTPIVRTPGTGIPMSVPGGSPLTLEGGYRNVYGTRVGGTYDPLSKEAGVNVQVPIGDHQRQLFFGINATGNPETRNWGAKLSLTKKIAPPAPTAGEAINAITGGALSRAPQGAPGVIQTDLRNNFMNSLTEDQLLMLNQGVKQYQREAVDQALGIRPGAEKYGLELGFRGAGDQVPVSSPQGIPGLVNEALGNLEEQGPGKEQLNYFIKERGLVQ